MNIDLWGRLKSLMSRVFIPGRTICRNFQAEPIVTDEMERALARWYDLYIDAPPWASQEVRPLGLPQAVVRELAKTVCAELTATVDGGPRAEYLGRQLSRYLANAQQGLELWLALGGLALKPYLSGKSILIDATGMTGFTPLRFDDGGTCVSGIFRSRPVKVQKSYYVKLEYHDLSNGVYTIRNKALQSNAGGICGGEVPLTAVPEWALIPPEVCIRNIEQPLFAYFTPPGLNRVDTACGIGASIYAGATEDLIRQADEQWAQFLYEFRSAERKIIGTANAIHGVLPGGKANPLALDRLYVAMPYDSDEFFREFSPALRSAGFYDGLQAILRRIEFNVGLAYGDLSDPATVEKTATEVISAKNRKYSTVQSLETRFRAALEQVTYGMDVYVTLYGLAPPGEYRLYVDFDDSILTDSDALRERDRQDVRDGLMQKWEYRVKWYGEDEATAKAMCTREPEADAFGFD